MGQECLLSLISGTWPWALHGLGGCWVLWWFWSWPACPRGRRGVVLAPCIHYKPHPLKNLHIHTHTHNESHMRTTNWYWNGYNCWFHHCYVYFWYGFCCHHKCTCGLFGCGLCYHCKCCCNLLNLLLLLILFSLLLLLSLLLFFAFSPPCCVRHSLSFLPLCPLSNLVLSSSLAIKVQYRKQQEE